jgi:hypothetical protein
MKLTYTLTLADYKAAQRLNVRQKLLRRINYFYWHVFVPIFFGSVIICSGVYYAFTQPKMLGFLLLFYIPLLWVAFAMPLMHELNTRKGFKQLSPPSRIDQSNSIEIDDDGIHSIMPSVREEKYFWAAIVGFAQNKKVTLFFTAENQFLFIPTYAFSPTQRTELNDLVVCHVVKRKQK